MTTEVSAGIRDQKEFLTITLSGQAFGIPVLMVQDVLGSQKITRVPMAPPALAGILNLRGRIVTAIDVRQCIGLPSLESGKDNMSVVVTQGDELFSLIIDSVGDVLSLDNSKVESVPATLDETWRNIATGVYQMNGNILVILDIQKLLNTLENLSPNRILN